MIARHQVIDRHGSGNLRDRRQPLGDCLRGIEVRRHDLHRVRTGLHIPAQIEESRDRRRVRIPQVKRIEIEAHEEEQRRGEHDQKERRTDDRNAVSLHEPVDWCECGEPHGLRLGRRLQHGQQCGQQGNAGQESYDHTAAGDLAELGKPPI